MIKYYFIYYISKGYRVYSREYGTKNPWNVKEVTATSNEVTLNYYTFLRLVFKVVAFNQKGESEVEQIEYDGYTGEGVPTFSPKQFRAMTSDVVTGYVTFTWQPVSEKEFNGYAKGYLIQYWNANNAKESWQYFYTTVKSNQVNIPMKANTFYYATIQTVNEKYFGPASGVIEFKTVEALPEKITEIVSIPFGSTAFELSWIPPKLFDCQHCGYNIYYRDVNREPSRKRKITIPNVDHYKLIELRPRTTYQIYIAGWSKSGEGEK